MSNFRGGEKMLGTIRNIFDIIKRILGVYSMIISLVEIDYEDLDGSQKEQKAMDWLNNIIIDLKEDGKIPEWAVEIFFNERFERWVISILVKIANRLGFFEHGEEIEAEKKREV